MATRDKSSKIGWSYSNIYRIYKDKSEEKPVVVAFEPLKSNLSELHRLHSELNAMIDQLEAALKVKSEGNNI